MYYFFIKYIAAKEFGFSDAERDEKLGGNLSLAFFLLGAPASVYIGYLTDRVNRIYLMTFVVILGATPAMLVFVLREYWHLFILRALTGTAIGGLLPLMFSLLGDLFPAEQRASASVVVSVASGIGIFLGQTTAGLIGPIHGWRFPYVILALPSIPLVFMLSCCVKEPKRGSTEVREN
jgi:MFS family permease